MTTDEVLAVVKDQADHTAQDKLDVIPLAPSFSAFIVGLYEHDYEDEGE